MKCQGSWPSAVGAQEISAVMCRELPFMEKARYAQACQEPSGAKRRGILSGFVLPPKINLTAWLMIITFYESVLKMKHTAMQG